MKIYWKQRNGVRISIDDMSEEHAKNVLKLVLMKLEKAQIEAKQKSREVILNGDMANEFNDQQESYFYSDFDEL